MASPWQQVEGEPAGAFTRFQVYLSLGPARSLRAAYRQYLEGNGRQPKGNKKQHRLPGCWGKDAARWNWQARARAFDLEHLAGAGQIALVAFSAYLQRIIVNALVGLAEDLAPGHPAWEGHLKTAQVMSGFFSADLLRQVLERQAKTKSAAGQPGGADNEPS
jgi:hypothetical protein